MMMIQDLTAVLFFTACMFHSCCGQCSDQESGICTYQQSYQQTEQISYPSSYAQKYTKACATWGWSRCNVYRLGYSTSYRIQYLKVYRQAYRCCPGWKPLQENGIQISSTRCTPICSPACLNGGSCCRPGTCECPNGYTGDQCQTPICSPPCRHGGTCTKTHTCTCTAGLTGQYCQTVNNTCPNDISTPTTPGKPDAIVQWNAIYVNGTKITSNYDPGEIFPIGPTVVTYMFDSDSLQTMCSFTVTVEDTEPPVLRCPREAEYFTESGQTRVSVQLDPLINTDNSGYVPQLIFFTKRDNKKNQEIINGSELPIGVTNVSVEAFDQSRNQASCEYAITVTARCPKGTSNSTMGELSWDPIIAGTTIDSLQRCPVATTGRNHGLARRNCSSDVNLGAVWENEELSDCGEPNVYQECDLYQVKLTAFNVQEMVDALLNITKEASMNRRQMGISCTKQTLANIVSARSPLIKVTKSVASVVDKIMGIEHYLQSNEVSIANISSSIVQLLEQQIHQTVRHRKQLVFVGENLAVKAQTVEKDYNTSSGFTFVIKTNNSLDDPDKINFVEGTILFTSAESNMDMNDSKISIRLPEEVFLSDNDTKVSFVVFKDDSLFKLSSLQLPRGQDDSDKVVTGLIISATVLGAEFDNLTKPLVFHTYSAKVHNTSPSNKFWNTTSTISCVFWDYNQNGGIGDWSPDGCELAYVDRGWITCHCFHLSTFAVVVEVPAEHRVISLVLKIVSKFGSAMSMMALFVVFLILLSGRIERTRSRKMLLHICLSAILLYFLILIGIEVPGWANSEIGCQIVGALIHYLILTTISWMAFEVRSIYTSFAIELEESGKDLGFLVLASVIAWGLPLAVVGIPFALGKEDYAYDNHCFLGHGHIHHFGLLLPFGILLQHNLATLVIIIFRMFQNGIGTTSKMDNTFFKKRVQDALLQVFVLECFWVSWVILETEINKDDEEATLALQLVLCISGSFLGCVIGLQFCFHNNDVCHIIKAACSKKGNQAPAPPRRSTSNLVTQDESPPGSPSYLIPLGHTEPYADMTISPQTVNPATAAATEFTYSYATCDNLYEDYEQMEGCESQSTSKIDVKSTSNTMTSIRGVDKVENEGIGTKQNAPSAVATSKATVKVKNPTYAHGNAHSDDGFVGRGSSLDHNYMEWDSDDDEYEPISPDEPIHQKKEKHTSVKKCDAKGDDTNNEQCDVDQDDEYEPISPEEPIHNKKEKHTSITDYWTGISDDVEQDDEYEPISPEEPIHKKKEKHTSVTDHWTAMSDDDHSYTYCDTGTDVTNNDNDARDDSDYEAIDEDLTDYENMNSPVGTSNRNIHLSN